MQPRNTICFRYITVNTLHTGDNTDDDDNRVVCLKTGLQLLPLPFLQTVQPAASSANFPLVIQQLLTSSSSSSCPSYVSFNTDFQKAVPMPDVTNPVSLTSFYCMYDIPLLLDPACDTPSFLTPSVQLILSSTTFQNFHVFFIYVAQCPSLSTTQSYVPSVLVSSSNLSPICCRKSSTR